MENVATQKLPSYFLRSFSQGYLPANKERRDLVLQRKREEYFGFIEQYYHSRTDDNHRDTYRQVRPISAKAQTARPSSVERPSDVCCITKWHSPRAVGIEIRFDWLLSKIYMKVTLTWFVTAFDEELFCAFDVRRVRFIRSFWKFFFFVAFLY